MESNKPKSLLADLLREIDQARNARPRVPQQPTELVRAREDRLAALADKISRLRRARENAGTQAPRLPAEEIMIRKRELIDTGTDKRYVRRNERGTSFAESDDVGRSLAADRRKHAKTKVKSGEGDNGDRPRAKTKRKTAQRTSRNTAARKGAARKSAGKTRAERRRAE